MTTETIFNADSTTTTTVAPVTPPTTPALPQEVTEFIGTGKKYATVDDALKSVPHAQKHISTLEAELATAKEELTKRKTTETLLEELRTTGIPSAATTAQPGVSTETITQLINQTLTQKEEQVKTKTNVDFVANAFIAKYGDKAETIYNTLAQESGLSVANLNHLAATSPSAVLKLAGMEMKKDNSVPNKTTVTVNTQAMNSTDNTQTLSSKVKQGASTKDLINAWKIAGQKVGKPA